MSESVPTTQNEPRVPALLPWLTLAITLLLSLRSLGGLLAEVQVSGAASGGMESLANGLSLDVIADTKALQETWHADTRSHLVISWTALAYTWVDVAFAASYVACCCSAGGAFVATSRGFCPRYRPTCRYCAGSRTGGTRGSWSRWPRSPT